MRLIKLINYHYDDTNKFRFVIAFKNLDYDVINTGCEEITFNALYDICGLWLLDKKIEKYIHREDSIIKIILKDS